MPLSFGGIVVAAIRNALTLLVILACAPAAAQSLVSRDKFTMLYMDVLRAAAPEIEVQVTGPMELTIEHDGNEVRAYLDNAYARYSAAPDMLDQVIGDYVAATVEQVVAPPAGGDVTRIVPVIKGATYLQELNAGAVGDEVVLIAHEPYNDDLIILYAEDTPRNIRYLGDEDLADMGVDRAGLREAAIANLDRLLPAIEARGDDGIYMLVADGNYEASLLLFDDIWSNDTWTTGGTPVAGEVVVTVPARDVLVVTGSRDAEGIATLRDIARDIVASDPYSLTDQLFVYRNGRFQPFEG